MPRKLHFLPFSIGPLLSQIPFLRLFLILLLSKGAFYECSGFMFQELFLEGNERHIPRSSMVRATKMKGGRRRKRRERKRRGGGGHELLFSVIFLQSSVRGRDKMS